MVGLIWLLAVFGGISLVYTIILLYKKTSTKVTLIILSVLFIISVVVSEILII